jgi:hypothetical protein
MELKVAVYNMEWMVNLFTRDGEPKTTGEEGERSGQLAEVVKAVDPDILGIVEARRGRVLNCEFCQMT